MVAATSRGSLTRFQYPVAALNGQVYMGFLVNFGRESERPPHYRSIEFWNGKKADPEASVTAGRRWRSVHLVGTLAVRKRCRRSG